MNSCEWNWWMWFTPAWNWRGAPGHGLHPPSSARPHLWGPQGLLSCRIKIHRFPLLWTLQGGGERGESAQMRQTFKGLESPKRLTRARVTMGCASSADRGQKLRSTSLSCFKPSHGYSGICCAKAAGSQALGWLGGSSLKDRSPGPAGPKNEKIWHFFFNLFRFLAICTTYGQKNCQKVVFLEKKSLRSRIVGQSWVKKTQNLAKSIYLS